MATKRIVCEWCNQLWISTGSEPSGETRKIHTCQACGSEMMKKTMTCHEWEPMNSPEPKRITIQEVAEEIVRKSNEKFLKKQAAEAEARNREATARAGVAEGEAGKRDKWEAVKV